MKRNNANRLNRHQERKEAFTIVELIVVVAVIGILAIVAVFGFGTWRTRTAQTEVSSDLINLKSGMEDARNRTNVYPTYAIGTQFNGTNTTKAVFVQSKNVTVTYSSGSTTTYCVTAQSKDVTSVSMYINMASSNKNPQVGTC